MIGFGSDSLKESFIKMASENGWQSALEEFSRRTSLNNTVYTNDYFRTVWRFLLPLTKESNVLYIGYDWGVQLEHLARKVCTLTVATSNETKIAFLRLVRDQCSLTNFSIMEVDDVYFSEKKRATFDIIILDGYSKWLENEDRAQIWLKLHGLLREGGCVLCNTDVISWAHRIVLPLTTRYSSLEDLPAALWLTPQKKLFVSITKKSRDFLAQWGLEETRVYLALPHYRNNKVIIPMDRYAISTFFLKYWLPSRKHYIHNPFLNGMSRLVGPLWWLIYWGLDRLSPTATIITWKITS